MRVARFCGEYEAIAPLCDQTSSELAACDAAMAEPPQRWVAWDGDAAVAAASIRKRPDGRIFFDLAGEPGAAGPLSANVQAACRCDIYSSIDESMLEMRAALFAAGFTTVLTTEVFEVSFVAALDKLRHAPIPSGFAIITAREADPDRLFRLDNAVRSRVPGTDAWRGNREWFDAELTDPAAYLVAVDLRGNSYAGLARIWRNPVGLRFGLAGVTEHHRRTRVGPALIRLALEEAAKWGYPTFETETALTNQYLHHRLRRIADRSLGKRIQLVRRHEAGA